MTLTRKSFLRQGHARTHTLALATARSANNTLSFCCCFSCHISSEDPAGLNHYEQVSVHTPNNMAAVDVSPQQRRPAATATRDLDNLMASLSEFKVSFPLPHWRHCTQLSDGSDLNLWSVLHRVEYYSPSRFSLRSLESTLPRLAPTSLRSLFAFQSQSEARQGSTIYSSVVL